MIEHIVLFQWKESTTEEQKLETIAQLRSLKTKISQIVDITCGVNFSDRNRGYDAGLVVRLIDRSALQTYREHPDHMDVYNHWIQPNVEQVLAIDYEI